MNPHELSPSRDEGPLRVYVAGSSREMDRARAAMDYVRELGGVITFDWVAEIERVGSANDGLTDEQRRSSAAADLEGVEACDVFWLLAPETPSTGAWVELGIALGLRESIRIIVSGPGSKRSIFSALANIETPSDITAAHHIARLVREGSR